MQLVRKQTARAEMKEAFAMAERIPDVLWRRAQERFKQREDVENLRVGRTEVDEVPSSGRKVYRVDAFEAGDPNGRRYEIVLDEEGEEVDLAVLAERENKEFFARAPFEPGPPRAVAAPAASITIEPTGNILLLKQGETSQEIVTVTVPPNVGVSKLDVYFLADTTGSMEPIIAAVQTGANSILSALNTGFPALDMAFGVGNYTDFPRDPSTAFAHQLAPTTTVADVTNAINAWSLSGGGDIPEGQLFALDQLAETPGGTIGWRSDAKRIIVWFGDAPGHDPVCAAISGLPSDVTEASVTTKLVGQDISVIAISTDTGTPDALDGDPTSGADYVSACGPPGGTPGQATRITTATGGTLVVGIDETMIVDTIIDLVSSAAQTINNLSLVPTGSSAPFVVSITPGGGHGPLPGTVEHVLTFTVDFRGVEPCAKEDRVFDGFLNAVADGVVVARKRVQITVPACKPEVQYSYSVKFVCGVQGEDPPDRLCLPGVRPGIYATEVNIHNYHDEPVPIEKFVLPLVVEGRPRGREPEFTKVSAQDQMTLPPNTATMDDCCRIAELLFGQPAPAGLRLAIGLLEIVSPRELHVTAVYTVTNARGGASVSIDVEQIAGKLKEELR
jgi:hypothetical protein